MTTIIDRSEHLSQLTVLANDSLIIEKDAGSPQGNSHVRVIAQGVVLDAGSNITIKHYGVLNVGGLTNDGALGVFDIGDHGTLRLNSSIGLQVAANIQFLGHTEPTRLVLDNADVKVLGTISGFGVHDIIATPNSAAVTATWTQGHGNSGVLALYDADHNQVGAIALQGQYTTANFAVKTEAKGATIKYVSAKDLASAVPEGAQAAGFALLEPAHESSFSAAGAFHGGTMVDHTADAMMGLSMLHHAWQHS
jgi:hypothetical protein